MSATLLKRIAFICMIIDHIGVFIPGTPIWFRWIGRLSAPIFIFLFAWSIDLTHDYTKLKIRIFTVNLIMCLWNLFLNTWKPDTCYTFFYNNIFGTFFALMLLIETYNAVHKKIPGWRNKLIFYVILQLISLSAGVIPWYFGMPDEYIFFITALTGNLFFNEGGSFWILIGFIFYLIRKDRFIMSLTYLTVSIGHEAILVSQIVPKIVNRSYYQFGEIGGVISEWIFGVLGDFEVIGGYDTNLFLSCYQWMMIFALPFILLYNGKRGNGGKYFYYWFYPLHLMVLTSISAFL